MKHNVVGRNNCVGFGDFLGMIPFLMFAIDLDYERIRTNRSVIITVYDL